MDIKKIIQEEVNDFDWTSDIDANMLSVGNFIFVDGSDNKGPNWRWDEDDYMVLEIISVNGDEVEFITRYTNLEGEGDNVIDSTSYENARVMVDNEYWKQWDGKQGLNESEFEWVEDIKPFNLNDCDWIIETTNIDEWTEVEQFMFDNGWRWGDAEEDEQIHSDYEGQYHFFFTDDHSECGDLMFDAADEGHFYNGRNELLDEYSDSKFIKWSDIRRQVMNESDEFEWAEKIPIPPIHVGGKLKTPNGNTLTITKIDNKRKLTGLVKMVHWKVFHEDVWQDASDRYWDVEKRIEDGIWTPVK